MSKRQPAPPPSRSNRWWLPPVIWSPIAIILVSAAVGLGIAYAMKDRGPTFITNECRPTEPGCEPRQKVHWHADFALYIDGTRVPFDDAKYISTENDPKGDAVHIHDPRHTVIHVHKEQTTWSEFFTSLKFSLSDPSQNFSTSNATLKLPTGEVLTTTSTKTFKFLVNGVRVDGIAALDISDLDRVLISYGSETIEQARAQFDTVTDQACIPSELCRDRLPPGGVEAEPCSKSGTTCN